MSKNEEYTMYNKYNLGVNKTFLLFVTKDLQDSSMCMNINFSNHFLFYTIHKLISNEQV